jgi:hypothetical protein
LGNVCRASRQTTSRPPSGIQARIGGSRSAFLSHFFLIISLQPARYNNVSVKRLSVEAGISADENTRPHVVILGAGASLAAFPNGDRNGRRLPLMKDFVDVVALRGLATASRPSLTPDTSHGSFFLTIQGGGWSAGTSFSGIARCTASLIVSTARGLR